MGEGVPRPQLSLKKVRHLARLDVTTSALARLEVTNSALSPISGRHLRRLEAALSSSIPMAATRRPSSRDSAGVESLLVTYVDRETVRYPPSTRPSLGPLCRPQNR